MIDIKTYTFWKVIHVHGGRFPNFPLFEPFVHYIMGSTISAGNIKTLFSTWLKIGKCSKTKHKFCFHGFGWQIFPIFHHVEYATLPHGQTRRNNSVGYRSFFSLDSSEWLMMDVCCSLSLHIERIFINWLLSYCEHLGYRDDVEKIYINWIYLSYLWRALKTNAVVLNASGHWVKSSLFENKQASA